MSPTQIVPTILSIELPAGDYYVGDPCYAFNHDDWALAFEQMQFDTRQAVDRIQLPNGRWFVLTSTRYGDGGYRGSDGYTYGVDAGCIGVVPVQSASDPVPTPHGLNRVTFDRPFIFNALDDDGNIVIGDITIPTGDTEIDADECERCGTIVEWGETYCWSCEPDEDDDNDI